jgi:hypothetical protein
MCKKSLFFITTVMFWINVHAQREVINGSISFQEIKLLWNEENIINQKPLTYFTTVNSNNNYISVKANLLKATYRKLNDDERYLLDYWVPAEKVDINCTLAKEKKKQLIYLKFTPLRNNPLTNKVEIIETYSIEIDGETNTLKSSQSKAYSSESLLKSGNWYKIKVDTTGVYRLTYDELKIIGISNPEYTRVYSYGGKQLPLWNNVDNFDDLNEIPTEIDRGSDNTFNTGDYIMFYAVGPATLSYNSTKKMFLHTLHGYSDFIYLFLTSDLGEGSRIQSLDLNEVTPVTTSSSFDDYRYHEIEKYNLVRSGRRWYGEKLKPGDKDSILFYFPNLVNDEKISGYISVAGRKGPTSGSTYFSFTHNNKSISTITVDNSYTEYTYATNYTQTFSFNPTSPSKIYLKYMFYSATSSPEGYIDKICLNARENLIFNTGHQLLFRDSRIPDNIYARFNINNNGHSIDIWDVTTPTKPVKMASQVEGESSGFNFLNGSSISEFVAFDESGLLKPIIEGDDLGLVANQNIHAEPTADLVIVSNSKFLQYADSLADLHRQKDSLSVLVVTPQQLYNEFSGGTPDVTAIRNYMRMLYNRSEVNPPKYLLLFGDGTYDNKNIMGSGSNLILTYQSETAESETTSFVTDDFFGMLDDNEGANVGALDIGIGRFPVQTEDEAKVMVDKVKQYMSTGSMGDWRNKVTFIADDEDSGVHLTDADAVCKYIDKSYPEFNINKIYLDAYKQVSISSGERYPEVTKAIKEQVERGSAIIDYVGHGNPRLLAHEEILTVQDVKSWTNDDKLSLFVTASCEVGRFDDHDRTSLGEWIILNPNGGGVVAFTTTRVVYIQNNATLNMNFFKYVLNRDLRMGDIILSAKNNTGDGEEINKRNFTLLGDPALKLALPQNKIIVTEVNGNDVVSNKEIELANSSEYYQSPELKAFTNDTINALDTVRISGKVVDSSNNTIYKNGILYISIFDKSVSITSNGNNNTTPEVFELQNSVLYKGKDTIVNGSFDFSFIVPKDINYNFGNGKISLYATIDSIDATGFSNDFMLGGTSDAVISDWDGPEIKLFMNDTNFVDGGVTDANPVLLAQLIDNSGINTTGNGIGHNITAILDDDQDNVMILNNFYEGYINLYNSGEVRYPLSSLATGKHSIVFKTWDIYNNSSKAQIDFIVYDDANVVIENLKNYPNPFYDYTDFVFEHNQPYGVINVVIEIFDLTGQEVARLTTEENNGSYAINPIRWTGTSNGGAKLAKGLYIYRAHLTTSDGRENTKSSKLMILK